MYVVYEIVAYKLNLRCIIHAKKLGITAMS